MTEQEMVKAQARLDAIEHGGHSAPRWYSDDGADVRAENSWDSEDPYFIAGCNSSSKLFSENATFIAHAPDDLRKALAALQRVRKLAVDSLRNGTAVSEGSYYSSVRSAQVLASIEDRLERDDDDEEDALDQLESAGSTVPEENEAAGGSPK